MEIDTKLTIKPVTELNYQEILDLKVEKNQESFIESTKECLAEARILSLWNPVGIYNQDQLIGFAMYGEFKNEGEKGRVWLDRFLIDKKYQGCGYGEAALELLIMILFNEYSCTKIYLSLYEENKRAIHIYQKYGFCFIGEEDCNGEKIMTIEKESFLMNKS